MLKKILFDMMYSLAATVYMLGELKVWQKIYDRYEDVLSKYEEKYPNGIICACCVVHIIVCTPIVLLGYIVKDKIEKK